MENTVDATTPRKRRRYTVEEKLEILQVARSSSSAIAQERFGASRSSINEWCRSETTLLSHPRSSKRCVRTGSSSTITEECPCETTQSLQRTEGTISTSSTAQVPAQHRNEFDATDDAHQHGRPTSSPTLSVQELPHAVASCFERSLTSCNGPGAGMPSSSPVVTIDQHQDPSTPVSQLLRPLLTSSGVEAPSEIPACAGVIGFHGEDGGFAEIATRRLLSVMRECDTTGPTSYQPTGYPQVVHMLEALSQREIDYAIVATETLFSASFHAALDRVVLFRFGLIAEVKSEEIVYLCGLPGANLRNADCVMSNWDLLARCEEYLLRLECENNQNIHRQVSWDSATACRIIREEDDRKTLVLCSKEAASANGLIVLQARVPTSVSSTTYVVIGRRGASSLPLEGLPVIAVPSPPKKQSTCLVRSSQQAPLVDIVTTFARLNLKIEQFRVHDDGDDRNCSGQTCVVSYRTSNAVVEATLAYDLTATAERFIHLGSYFICNLREATDTN